MTASVLKKRSKTRKRLKERFLIRRNRTKRANFRGSPLFQDTYTAVLKVVIMQSRSVSSLFMMVRGANFPPTIAWKVFNTLGFFSFSWSNLSLVCFDLLILFRQRLKVIISKSWSLPMSAPRKLCVLALFTPDWKRFLTRM